jgi:hypothetical protein
MKHYFPVLIALLFGINAWSQTSEPMDTVYLMSGKTVTGIVKDSTDDQLKILVPKKGQFKSDFIDLDLVFSVKYRNGKEEVFYKQDTLFGNYFTEQEVRYYMAGERDARRSYHSRLWCAGGFALGCVGGYFRSPITVFTFPLLYPATTTFFRIKIKPGSVSNPENIKYDTYVLGYEKEARKQRVFRSLIWTGVGTVIGFTTSAILNPSPSPF